MAEISDQTPGNVKQSPDLPREISDEQMQEIISVLPEEKRELLIRRFQALTVAKSHCGPIPSPEDIALYNRHIPDGADRIMRMAEKQADHRISIETTVIVEQQRQSARGQVFGLIIGLFGISVGAWVAVLGHDAVGGGIAGTTVISLVYAFISGRQTQRRDLQKKTG
jgi:uncharacterized membrane protein